MSLNLVQRRLSVPGILCSTSGLRPLVLAMAWVGFFLLPSASASALTADRAASSTEQAESEADWPEMSPEDSFATESILSLAIDPNDIYRAKVVAIINKAETGSSAQKMKVYVDGVQVQDAEGNLEWSVSTGREKYEKSKSGRSYKTVTPLGYFRPTRIVPLHKSKTWHADMPYAVFFIGGIATHATNKVEDLGKRASGGCVRLTPKNAKRFYQLVKSTAKQKVTLIDRGGKDVLNADQTPVTLITYDTLIIVENRI